MKGIAMKISGHWSDVLDLGAEFGGREGGTGSAGAPLWRICTVQVYKTKKYHGQTELSLTGALICKRLTLFWLTKVGSDCVWFEAQ
jgi:hypothetical protein